MEFTENAETAVGAYAKKVSSTQPGRVVSSAKSWLCSDNVDCMSAILPAGSQDERKVSPVEACAEYLKHIAAAWDNAIASENEELKIANQQVILTVPASFDAAARELTVLAAEEAGLNITLLEEPQAAFYNWLHEHEDSWRDKVEAGSSILVCDVGGGTTDFSLIGVDDEDGDPTLQPYRCR